MPPANRQKEELALAAVRVGMLSIHDDGSVWRVLSRTRTGRLRQIEPTRVDRPKPDGYRCVSVCAGGREYKVLVHRLVWLASGQDIPDGHEINHRDGNRANNHLSNLEPLTPGKNLAHSYRELGRVRPCGERNNRGRLTAAAVSEIRRLSSTGLNHAELGRRFGVTRRSIRLVVNGETWRDEYPEPAR